MSDSKDLSVQNLSGAISLSLAEHAPQVESFAEQSQRAVIDSDEAMQRGTDLMTLIKGVHKELDETRKALGKPLRDATTQINTEFNVYLNKLDDAKKAINSKMLAYHKQREAEERKRREEERKAREEAALKAAESATNEEEQEAILEAAVSVTEESSKAAPVHGNLGGTTHTRTTWSGEVVDPKAFFMALANGDLPHSLVSFSKAGLNAEAKRHGKEEVIHGIECKKNTALATRG